MIKNVILAVGMVVLASPALANGTTSASDAIAGATNTLSIEGSVSASVGVGNNTAPCQQVNGISVLGTGMSSSRTLEWCQDMETVKFLTQVVKLRGAERKITLQFLCGKPGEFRDVLVASGHCVIKKVQK